MLAYYELIFRPAFVTPLLNESEYWLAEYLCALVVLEILNKNMNQLTHPVVLHQTGIYLVSPNEMDSDAGVCEVNQPERLVESESGEKVSRCIISKR